MNKMVRGHTTTCPYCKKRCYTQAAGGSRCQHLVTVKGWDDNKHQKGTKEGNRHTFVFKK